MKEIILILLISISIQSLSQEKRNSYFVFYKGGKEYLKPIKYILFDSQVDEKRTKTSEIFFYIKGERFKFSKKEHKIDTCNIKYLKKIKLSKVDKLSNEEFQYRKEKLKEDSHWENKKIKPPMPITKLHPYYKVFIIIKNLDKIIKYEVDWENSHSY